MKTAVHRIARRATQTIFAGAATTAVAIASSASADEAAPPPDQMPASDDGARHAIDRTWLYLDDARVAAPMTVIGSTGLAYTGVGSNPDRIYAPLGFNTAQPGFVMSVGAEAGIFPRLSVFGVGQLGADAGAGTPAGGPNAGAVAGLRVQILPSTIRDVHLVASAGYLREAWAPTAPHGDNGAWGEAAFSADWRALRVGATAHGEHVFAEGRDGVDVMAKLGVSYRIVGGFRLGAEWVGQDLEETFSAEAEGGARQFVGPTASLQLFSDRFTIVGGPSVGLSSASPKALGRLALAYGF